MARGDYEVGFGKPPRHSQFRPGRSGNPAGRPKGSKNLATIVKAMLNEEILITENGKSRKVTKGEAAIMQLLAQGVRGDLRAIKEITSLYHYIEHVDQHEPDSSHTTENDVEVLANLRRRMQQSSSTKPGGEESK